MTLKKRAYVSNGSCCKKQGGCKNKPLFLSHGQAGLTLQITFSHKAHIIGWDVTDPASANTVLVPPDVADATTFAVAYAHGTNGTYHVYVKWSNPNGNCVQTTTYSFVVVS